MCAQRRAQTPFTLSSSGQTSKAFSKVVEYEDPVLLFVFKN